MLSFIKQTPAIARAQSASSPPSSGPREEVDSRLSGHDQTELSETPVVCRRGLINKAQNCWLNATVQALETVVPGWLYLC